MNIFNMQGGKLLSEGGYGCVFKPPIKCENSTSTDEHGISKLMLSGIQLGFVFVN